MRKLLIMVAAIGMVVGVTASPASAADGGIVVFSGNSVVGGGAFTDAPGKGLCFPGMGANSAGKCVVGAPVTDNGWKFDVPATDGPVVGCHAFGVIAGAVHASEGGLGNCTINSDGIVTSNGVVPPSCGMSRGTSNGGTADSFSATDVAGVTRGDTITTLWITSAGGTLPITGKLGPADYVGVVQARALNTGACVDNAATTFYVVGITASAAA